MYMDDVHIQKCRSIIANPPGHMYLSPIGARAVVETVDKAISHGSKVKLWTTLSRALGSINLFVLKKDLHTETVQHRLTVPRFKFKNWGPLD